MIYDGKVYKYLKFTYFSDIHLRFEDDETRINKYLLKTDNAVLGLFCRNGKLARHSVSLYGLLCTL